MSRCRRRWWGMRRRRWAISMGGEGCYLCARRRRSRDALFPRWLVLLVLLPLSTLQLPRGSTIGVRVREIRTQLGASDEATGCLQIAVAVT